MRVEPRVPAGTRGFTESRRTRMAALRRLAERCADRGRVAAQNRVARA